MAGVDEEDDYFIPLQDQRVFGAGVKRKGIAFVLATPIETLSTATDSPKLSNAGDRYLSIVLPKKNGAASGDVLEALPAGEGICVVCKQPVGFSPDELSLNAHESSIAHQVCLEHSHPPSHLDKGHVGLKYLAGYGWDPDDRKGLGARQEGIRAPIKAKEKYDTAGLRERVAEDDIHIQKKVVKKNKEATIVRLDAGAVRKQDMEAKKRAKKLRASFYGPDLENYLGPGG